MERLHRTLLWGMLGLATLTGCAGINNDGGRAATTAYFSTLIEHQVSGKTGTITGRLFLAQPGIPTPLRGWTVTLLPLSAEWEATLDRGRDPYLAGGHVPLTPAAFEAARRILDDLRSAVEVVGSTSLSQRTTTTTSDDSAFSFPTVAEGQWVLLAELSSKPSTLLWASPVTVEAGKTTVHILNDSAIWLEGLKP